MARRRRRGADFFGCFHHCHEQVFIPIYPTAPPPPPLTTPKPTYSHTYKPTYKPTYRPTYKPQKPSYKPPYVPEEPEYEPPYKPPYKPPPQKPSKPSSRNSYHFVSVENTSINKRCSRLYFLDSGVLKYPKGNLVVRNPVLWGFDIYGCDESTLDQPPTLKVKLPDYVYENPAGFHKFVVDDYGPSCSEFAVYIANALDNRVVVYDNVKRSFWYFDHETFQPGAELAYLPADSLPPQDPTNLGVLSLTLANTVKYSYKEVFYAPGSSYGLFRTTTKVLRDKHRVPGDPTSSDFEFVGYRGPESQSTFSFDGTSVVFSISWLNNRLTCWNTNKPLVEENVVTLFSDLQYGVDLTFTEDKRYLWFMMQNLDFDVNKKGALLFNDYYYRVYKTKVSDLIRGTNCE